MAIKELLEEELASSVRMERDYQHEIARLPRGCVVKKVIRGRAYYYLAFREKGKVRFQYQGRDMDVKKIALHQKAKKDRVRYRKLLSEVRNQIKFMRKALRAKQAV